MPLLSEETKVAICHEFEQGKTKKAIAYMFGVTRNTVARVIKNKAENGTVKYRLGNKNALKWTVEMLNCISNIVEINPCTTLKELQAVLNQAHGIHFSLGCISRKLKTLGIKRCIAASKPLLMVHHKQARLSFAIEHDVTFAFWRKVLFTDETSFEVGKLNGRVKIWRRRGSRFSPKNIVHSRRSGRRSIMFWGNQLFF